MSQGGPQGWNKVRYWWYRALGYSDTQAHWQVRDQSKSSSQPSGSRGLRHKNCEQCRYLMLINDQKCGHCGHKQAAPAWFVSIAHHFNIQAEFVIPVIVMLCLFGYLVQIKLGGTLFGGIGDNYEVSRRILIVGGALPLSLEEYLSAKHSWRLFTYTCLHGNLFHIGFNMLALIQIGPLVARTFGFSRTLFIWVASGATAIILPALIFPTHLTVGASGAVFGLIGVAMVFGHRIGTPQGLFIRNKMIEWTVFCTLFGMMLGGVAHSAHFGGLIGGGLLSFVIAPPKTNHAKLRSIFFLTPSLLFIAWSFWSAWDVFKVMSMF
jgi:rhomboid protease GluP